MENMILVVAGTLDGRKLAAYLKEKNIAVVISVTSGYGGLLAEQSVDEVIVDRMTESDFTRFLRVNKIEAVVDASHPYAVKVSENIMRATHANSIKYVRYERKATVLPDYSKLYLVDNAIQAAEKAAQLGDTVFLATGSRTLQDFKNSEQLKNKRVIVRILPDASSLNVCIDLNILPKDVIAMQGPFSVELNKAMFKDCNAEVIVTKDGGITGGMDSKMDAAMQLGLSVVMIKRPTIEYGNVTNSFEKIYDFIKGE